MEKQRQRADRAEKALEPLRHNIRQLTAEVEAKGEEIRVVRSQPLLSTINNHLVDYFGTFPHASLWLFALWCLSLCLTDCHTKSVSFFSL